ncbi:hypothetical protein [Mycolicibacterium sp.]|uniref:DUF7373 family lipoprotein n=1 Tax=Mycolicibacterium sp. TaxID=2320850 RepID=UPI0037C96239
MGYGRAPRRRLRREPGRIAVIAAAALLAGCSTVTTGTPVAAPPQAGPVDVATLNVGNYPVVPSAPMGTAVTSAQGAIIEGQRLADYVTGPWEVDASLSGSPGIAGMVLKSAEALKLAVPEALSAIAAKHNFVAGFFSGRESATQSKLANLVLQFSDPDAAKAATGEFVDFAANDQLGQRVTMDGRPDTVGFSYGAFDTATPTQFRAFTARGTYVLVQLAATPAAAGPDAARGLVAKTLDLQAPLIDTFTPTGPDKLAELPKDPTGLLARTLPASREQASVNQRTVYQPRGALHFQSDPVRVSSLFDQTGMTRQAVSATSVYETRDEQSAKKLADGLWELISKEGKPEAPVSMLPDSRCINLSKGQGDGYFYCLLTVDRYTIGAPATQLLDAQQKAAAQYAMLTAP